MNASGFPWPPLDTWINHLAVTPDSNILIGACIDRTIRLWHAQTNQPLFPPLKGHTNSVRCLIIANDGMRFFSGSDEGAIRVWNLNSPETSTEVWNNAHRGAVRTMALSPNGQLAASAGDDGTVRLWNIVHRVPVGESLKYHKFPIASLAFSSTGNYLASGDEGGCLSIWLVSNEGLKIKSQIKHPHAVPIYSLIATPGTDDVFAGCGDCTVRRWNLAASTQVGAPWKGHADAIRCVTLINNKLVTGSNDSTIRVWDTGTGAQIGEAWVGPSTPVETIATDPKGKFIASAGANELWSWFVSQ
ncbi:MAG: WD40 repeat domain-containing protein [Verrucomicrobiota bacterium]